MSNNFVPPYVNPHPHLHAGQNPPLHVDIHQPDGSHVPVNVQNALGAYAIQGAVFGPPKQ